MTKQKTKFKKGAASFYVVAFSTLILVIIVASFAAIIISAVIRASNDDLSQSAYDSALAGIEDAKLAYYTYQRCKERGATARRPVVGSNDGLTCDNIVWYMENDSDNCDMVAHILGRIGTDKSSAETGGVLIQETSVGGGNNNMQQAYTCVKIKMDLEDYRTTLTATNPTRVIRVKLNGTAVADDIESVVITWKETDGEKVRTRFSNINNGQVNFAEIDDVATPPVISVGLVQTSNSFTLTDFDKVTDGTTDRGTVFFVPTNDLEVAKDSSGHPDNYIGISNETGLNTLNAGAFVKSNDRTVKNLPYVVYCNEGGECVVKMNLPKVFDESGNSPERNDDTFAFVASLPYGGPSTDIVLKFYCSAANLCGYVIVDGEKQVANQARLEGVQINIDSTGRANDLYRRVEARLDNPVLPYPLYGLELLGENSGSTELLDKDMAVTSEHSASSYESSLQTLTAK
ncbi:hypothetical protein IKF73_01385 [Candidatus Saccharibacteria bacterium]|nr:hypothetical protein [Candidatus Saccharibacteria bacterium]